jgi:hypothetical protein
MTSTNTHENCRFGFVQPVCRQISHLKISSLKGLQLFVI